MPKSNKTARKARKFTAAQSSNLKAVRSAAFQSGTSRNAVIAATFAALGKRPVLTLYNAGKLELQIGFMAAALARKGDNREPDALMLHCRERLTKYQGFTGKAKLREGQLGRRTKGEEEAYASARVQVSGVMRDAGITVPEARGGDTSGTRTPSAGKASAKAKAKAKATASETKPVTIKAKTAEQFVHYALVQAKALQASLNRSAAVVPGELANAVNVFVTAAIAADKAL